LQQNYMKVLGSAEAVAISHVSRAASGIAT